MATENVVRITCDRCGKIMIVPPADSTTNTNAGSTGKFPFIAMGGSIIPDLFTELGPKGPKVTPTSVTVEDVCEGCRKRISDLVKQILYRTFKADDSDDNDSAPDDTKSVEAEAPRANRSKRTTQTTEEKGS